MLASELNRFRRSLWEDNCVFQGWLMAGLIGSGGCGGSSSSSSVMSPAAHIHSIPGEVLETVFAFLDPLAALACERVCEQKYARLQALPSSQDKLILVPKAPLEKFQGRSTWNMADVKKYRRHPLENLATKIEGDRGALFSRWIRRATTVAANGACTTLPFLGAKKAKQSTLSPRLLLITIVGHYTNFIILSGRKYNLLVWTSLIRTDKRHM